ncbi:hypothetical protein LCGC14_3104410, partial [marine sediment metagenome]
MTDLTTKTAQSLHDKWCRQMREKGRHGPGTGCTYDDLQLSIVRANCNDKIGRCKMFHPDLIPWPDLPESHRQEYLATAKAVLPEIDQAIAEARLDEHKRRCVSCTRGYGDDGWS